MTSAQARELKLRMTEIRRRWKSIAKFSFGRLRLRAERRSARFVRALRRQTGVLPWCHSAERPVGSPFPKGADKMKVEMTTMPGDFVEGRLERIISKHDGGEAHVVLEMSIPGGETAARLSLNTMDLAMLVRLAGSSAAQKAHDYLI
jgi:hypothetical protein